MLCPTWPPLQVSSRIATGDTAFTIQVTGCQVHVIEKAIRPFVKSHVLYAFYIEYKRIATTQKYGDCMTIKLYG